MSVVKSIETVGKTEFPVLIEVDGIPPSHEEIYKASRGDRLDKVAAQARDLFGDGLELARTCATQVIDTVNQVAEDRRPQEFQIALAIKLDAEIGAVLAKSSAGAQMQVTMTWRGG